MIGILIAIAAGIVSGVANAAFLSAFPLPFSSLNIPILVVVGLLFSFRFHSAFAAAAFAGFVWDAIAGSGGERLLVMLVSTALALGLFTHILTHVSTISFLAVNAAAFAIFGLGSLFVRMLSLWYHGISPSILFTASAFASAGAALLLQTLAAGLGLWIAGVSRRTVASQFLIRR